MNIVRKLVGNLVVIIAIAITVNGYAQINPGIDFDLQGFIDEKISSGETNIVIPAGRYRVKNNGNTHLKFDNLNDITIVADSVEMICTETVQAIQIDKCTNFKLKGLAIDYDPLPFTQGRIVDISSGGKVLIVDIIDGYSTTVRGDKLEIFDSISGELSTNTYYGVSYEMDKEKRQVIITKPSSGSNEKVGDIAVMGSQNTRSIPHTILPANCIDLVLEDVRIYSGTTFAYFETNCKNSQYIRCEVDRRPLATEIAERGFRRMRSNNADGFHSKHASIGPKYIECIARYNGDDGIAINGDYHIILASAGKKLIVVGKHGNKPKLYPDNVVELVSYTGERIEDATVTAIVDGPPLSGAEKAFLQNQYFAGSLSNSMPAAGKVYIVTLDRSVDLPMGSLIAASNRIGNGFEVRNCIMGPNRSRGILVKASDGIITGNSLVGNWGQAIKLSPEYSWLEAGSGSNVTVSDNTITECHDAAIAVYAMGGNGNTAPAGAHKNITITGNKISGSTNPAIALTSIKGLTLEDNTIDSPNNTLLAPWIANNFGRKEDPSREIYMKNVVIEGDAVSKNEKPSYQPAGIKVKGNHFSDQLMLEPTSASNLPYAIYNSVGKKVFSSTTMRQTEINTSNWNCGLYILVIDKKDSVKLLKSNGL